MFCRLWNQLEAEIYLHRHKTIIRACRGKRLLKHKSNIVDTSSSPAAATSSASAQPSTAGSSGLNGSAAAATASSSSSSTVGRSGGGKSSSHHTHDEDDDDEEEDDVDDEDEDEEFGRHNHHLNTSYQKVRDLAQVRTVRLKRNEPKEGLGISITGGILYYITIGQLFMKLIRIS